MSDPTDATRDDASTGDEGFRPVDAVTALAVLAVVDAGVVRGLGVVGGAEGTATRLLRAIWPAPALLLAYGTALLIRRPSREDAGWARPGPSLRAALVWAAALAPLLLGGLALGHRLAPGWLARSLPSGWAVAPMVLVLAPLCEEPLFRGVVHPALRRAGGPALAVGGGALVFAVAHLARTPFPIVQLLGGLILHLLYERTGSLAGPVLLHALGNGALLAAGLYLGG